VQARSEEQDDAADEEISADEEIIEISHSDEGTTVRVEDPRWSEILVVLIVAVTVGAVYGMWRKRSE
jgi:hypothetical protein